MQADFETKELRDAARLEASRRAKQEAEAKIREQKAQRQAEVEQRRQQERAEKEARDARERQEKEARRLAAVAEAKAKAAQEVSACVLAWVLWCRGTVAHGVVRNVHTLHFFSMPLLFCFSTFVLKVLCAGEGGARETCVEGERSAAAKKGTAIFCVFGPRALVLPLSSALGVMPARHTRRET